MRRVNDFVLELKHGKTTSIQNYQCSNLKMAQIVSFYMREYKDINYSLTIYSSNGKVFFSTVNPNYEENN